MAQVEWCLLLLLLAVGTNHALNSYFVTFPNTLIPGSSLDLTIDILKENVTVPVEASIVSRFYDLETREVNLTTLQTVSGNFIKGETGTLSLPIKPGIDCSNCMLSVRGRGGLQFEDTGDLFMSSQTVSVLIQTDKAIYKPSQTVLFRTLAVYHDLKLYKAKFNVEILDPRNNKIKVLNGLEGSHGVVEGSFKLSDQPLFGLWSIVVTLESFSDRGEQTFEVADYDLPMFEVIVELPPFGLVDDSQLTGKVKAKYTFGQPVMGMVELHVGQNVLLLPDACGESKVKTTQISFEINGESSFTIPKEDIQRSVSVIDGSNVRVTAFVTETTTGIRLNGSSVVKFYKNKFQVKFLDKTPNVFKPGLPYTAFIQVTSPDNLPPSGSSNVISAYTYVTYSETVPDQEFYSTTKFTGYYPLPGRNLTLPASGILPIEIDIPKNATSINIRVTFGSVSVTKVVDKTYSKSLNFIQLSLLDKNVKAGDDVRVNVVGTEPLNKLSYKVLSRGSSLTSGKLDGKGEKSLTFTFRVTSSMAPTARLIVYYDRNNDEIVADGLAFNVDGLFHNRVSIAFSANETQPGEDVDVVLAADPGSKVNILAIDQSVLLLKSGNDITPDKVKGALSAYDENAVPTDTESALSTSAKTASELFNNVGFGVITDLKLTAPEPDIMDDVEEQQSFRGGRASFDLRSANLMADNFAPQSAKISNLQPVDKIRQFFPETWIWNTSEIGSSGKLILKTPVPDTITSWVASAFATNLETGLGVAPTTSMLRVFKSFFVSLNYPRSVVRNEQFVVQATVFNYLGQDLTVKVTLKSQAEFKSIKISQDGSESLLTGNQVVFVSVKPDKQAVAYFPILATSLGLVDIEVTAQTTVAADGVSRQILVKPEGAPVNYNVPVFINLPKTPSQTFEKNISFTLPTSVVEGSENARVKATGDLIGSSLSSLTSLITLPTGCGEQAMVKFAPDLHIAQYLEASGQMTDVLRKKILESLEGGHQRLLTYQRFDGGFSAFGNYDKSGSTWLTAFTSRILTEAREFIYVDPMLLIRSNKWIIDRQNPDGSFNEFGKILDSNTQGAGTGPALTAFALLSLLAAKNLFIKPSCQNDLECRDFYLWRNATEKAQANLEGLVISNSIKEKFPLSVVSYALSKAKSLADQAAFKQLLKLSKKEGNVLYWQANSSVTDSVEARYLIWRPPRIQARPIDILITSYAILTYVELERMDEALPSVRWLTTQRNAQGGFSSTQDTVVGLHALSAYATKSLRQDTQLDIQVNNPIVLAEFSVNKNNALNLQIKKLPGAPKDVVIGATGNGIALVDIDYSFHVNAELSTPSFEVNTIILDDKLDTFNLMICSRWLLQRDSGMVVQEISIPSGFKPDLSSLDNVAGLSRSERRGDAVAIYFDKIGSTSLCYSLRMVRESKVAKSERNYVRTFGYYDPDDQSTVFYQPKAIRDATICDVCNGCCP